jgi:hypothetical protein
VDLQRQRLGLHGGQVEVFSEFVVAEPVVVAFELVEPADCVTPCINRSESGPPGGHRTGAWSGGGAVGLQRRAARPVGCLLSRSTDAVAQVGAGAFEDFVGEGGVGVGDGT